MPRPIELSSDLLYSMKFDLEMLTSLNNVSVKLLEYNKRPGFLKKLTLTEDEVEVLDQITQIYTEVYKRLYESAD